MVSQTLRFILDQSLKQGLAGRKRGEDENTTIWISREQKELSRWNKKRFSVFKGLLFGEKQKIDKNWEKTCYTTKVSKIFGEKRCLS